MPSGGRPPRTVPGSGGVILGHEAPTQAGQGGALSQGKYAPSLMGATPKVIYEAMITGPQSMPVFSDKTITPAEKLSMIKWIKAAQNEPSLGGASLGRVGPVTEGLLIWTFGLGLLIAIAVWLATKAR